jgi:seryl-tRNA synthetase
MEKLKQNLTSIIGLLAIISGIGGAFYAWGIFEGRISKLEQQEYTITETVDLSAVNLRINTLTEKTNDIRNSLSKEIAENHNISITTDAEALTHINDIKSNLELLRAENKLFTSRLDELWLKQSNPLLGN